VQQVRILRGRTDDGGIFGVVSFLKASFCMTSTLPPLALIVRQFVGVQVSIMLFLYPCRFSVVLGCFGAWWCCIFFSVALMFLSLAVFSVVTRSLCDSLYPCTSRAFLKLHRSNSLLLNKIRAQTCSRKKVLQVPPFL
jgi:hypothetical protein